MRLRTKEIILVALLLSSCTDPRAEIEAEAKQNAATVAVEYPVTEPSNSTSWRNFQSEEGMKLAQAIEVKNKEFVSQMLTANPALANSKYRAQGCFHSEEGPILFLALSNPEMVALLLENGADIEARNKSDMTPLMQAAFDTNIETVKLLVAKGANTNAIRTVEAHRESIWDNKTQTRETKDVPEQKLTALALARLNLQSYEKYEELTDREEKISSYKKIIQILAPITSTSNL